MAIAESPGWLATLNTTIPMYLREAMNNIMRSRILLARLEQMGRISYNNSGTHYAWPVKYKRNPMEDFADGDVLTFGRVDRYKTAELNNDRGYVCKEMMSITDTLQNSGNEAIIKLWSEKAEVMMDDIRENFADQFYIDGNAAGNEKKIHGIESFMGGGAAVAAPGFVQPSDTFAGLSTALGNQGGTFTGTWPVGSTQTPQYDYWSPLLVDYTSPVAGAYSSSTRTWPNTCTEALRKAFTYTQKKKAQTGKLDLVLLEGELLLQWKNAQDNKQQIKVERGQNAALVSMGFTDIVEQDGIALSTEYGMPLNTGYCFNSNMMELRSMQAELFKSHGPIFSEETMTYRWILQFIGNMIWNPPFFAKLYPYGLAA